MALGTYWAQLGWYNEFGSWRVPRVLGTPKAAVPPLVLAKWWIPAWDNQAPSSKGHVSLRSMLRASLLYVRLSHPMTPPKINNEHKNGDELLLMLSWEGEAFWKERSMFPVYYDSFTCKGWCQDLGKAWVCDLTMRLLKSRNHGSLSIREQMFIVNWTTNTCQALGKELTVQFCIFCRLLEFQHWIQ